MRGPRAHLIGAGSRGLGLAVEFHSRPTWQNSLSPCGGAFSTSSVREAIIPSGDGRGPGIGEGRRHAGRGDGRGAQYPRASGKRMDKAGLFSTAFAEYWEQDCTHRFPMSARTKGTAGGERHREHGIGPEDRLLSTRGGCSRTNHIAITPPTNDRTQVSHFDATIMRILGEEAA